MSGKRVKDFINIVHYLKTIFLSHYLNENVNKRQNASLFYRRMTCITTNYAYYFIGGY